MPKFLVLIFVLLISLHSGATNIRCQNTEYAGKQLGFYRPSDPVSGETELYFTLKFDASGKAAYSADIKTSAYVFSEFGVYRGMLFLEPDKTIELKLPPFREKSFADQKNPYFAPVSFWVITEKGTDVNDKISAFEQQLNYLADKNFNQLYMFQSKTVYDSVKIQLAQLVPATAEATLKNHAQLKIESLEADIFRKRPESYAAVFNNIQPEYWLHPAFLEFFNKTFDKQLSFSAQAIKGEEVKRAVETHDIQALAAFAEKKYHLTGIMTDLALLKMLHDAFYSNEFSKKAILNLVKAGRFTKNSNELIRTTALNISRKITFMQVGSPAPVICLQNLAGQKVCTNSTNDKFKYLVFADSETMVCREHLKYISRIDELFHKNLEIFVILRDTDPKEMLAFFDANKVPAVLLVDKGDPFIKAYKVRSFPQCFLLNEQHLVVFDNAKAPLDGFEQQFGAWLRNELFMRQRNQSK